MKHQNVEIKSLNVEALDVKKLVQQLEEVQSCFADDKCPQRSRR